MFLLFLELLCLLLLFVWIGAMAASLFTNAPWVPLRGRIIDKMLELAELKPGELLVDLGSGDGRVVIRAANKFAARGLGIELNPILVWFSRLEALFRGLRARVKIKRENIFKADLSSADVVALYLFPEISKALGPKLQRELKPGARVVSVAFGLGGWTPVRTVNVGAQKVYFYKKDVDKPPT
jgi:SAM-dependent methyltransferase